MPPGARRPLSSSASTAPNTTRRPEYSGISPKHDYTSHTADAFRYLAMAWREWPPCRRRNLNASTIREMTLNELFDAERKSSTPYASEPGGKTPGRKACAKWFKEIARAERHREEWLRRSEKLLKLYRRQRGQVRHVRRFAMLWANTEVLKPSDLCAAARAAGVAPL